ncbi:MAG: transposase [Candidatus Brocadiales bacterium]
MLGLVNHVTGHTQLHINYLPAYHPELNYQELLWSTLRYEETTNVFFETIEEMKAGIFKISQRWQPQN